MIREVQAEEQEGERVGRPDPGGEGRWVDSPIKGEMPRFQVDKGSPAWRRALQMSAAQRRN